MTVERLHSRRLEPSIDPGRVEAQEMARLQEGMLRSATSRRMCRSFTPSRQATAGRSMSAGRVEGDPATPAGCQRRLKFDPLVPVES
jgi:hypothetical protein